MDKWISLAVFTACYVLFIVLPNRRSWVACGGAIILIISGVLPWDEALVEKINWNVMGLFFGTLILAEMFMHSRVPAVIAEWLVDKMSTGRGAILILCTLSGIISAFVENVAVVLLMAPVAFSVAEKLKTNPVPILIGIAISSNLQGTATMIGDPPSMILAGYMHMGFLDFFIYHGRPGIFFAVEIGAIASLFVLFFIFRKEKQQITVLCVEKILSLFPSVLLIGLILALSVATLFDSEFRWFAGTITMVLALIGVIWFRFIAKWGSLRKMFWELDWDTTFFLIGVFVVVGGLSDSGWLDVTAVFLSRILGSNVLLAFIVIVFLSVVLSAFVDNVPFLLAMIPVVQKLGNQMQGAVVVLMFGLLIGSCLGGNITPIGASANVVTIGLLKKNGYTVTFRQFLRIGIPFTVAAVLAACIFVWLTWGV